MPGSGNRRDVQRRRRSPRGSRSCSTNFRLTAYISLQLTTNAESHFTSNPHRSPMRGRLNRAASCGGYPLHSSGTVFTTNRKRVTVWRNGYLTARSSLSLQPDARRKLRIRSRCGLMELTTRRRKALSAYDRRAFRAGNRGGAVLVGNPCK